MRKKAAPADRRTRIRWPIGDPARERQANIAYGTYLLKALHRFDLEGKAESVRQLHARNSPPAATARRAVRDQVRGILEHEQAYQTELMMALGEKTTNKTDRVNQPRAGGARRSREI